MSITTIEWTDRVWNPVTGCAKVSQGCKHCYAEGIAKRFWGNRKFTDVRCHPERLEQPLKWKKPARIFVNSMSDLFHEDVPDSFILRVFEVMAFAKQHTFQVLTKRPERMKHLLSYGDGPLRCDSAEHHRLLCTMPLPNVWLGVSVEDQKTADERIPLLLQTPGAVRFISAEPLLGPISLRAACPPFYAPHLRHDRISWVIVGGESGPGARPMHPEWARLLRDQCQTASVPCFFKQWGEFDEHGKRVGKQRAGRLLDGREWNEVPS